MKKIVHRLSICVLVTMMLVVNCMTSVSAQSTQNRDLEFYPSPQQVEYANDKITLSKDINIVAEENIDKHTKAKIEEVLKIKDLSIENGKVTYGDVIVQGKVNILLGVYGSAGIVDTYFEENSLHEATHFEKNDAHILAIKEDTIAILGKNTDATFYGITTLKQIFNQVAGIEIPMLTIKDFSDIEYRGFIEGYYGTPWTTEGRIALMKYGGDLKMNQYMFAPKDDIYHNKQWRTPYPESELAEIAKLAKAGEESKNHFVWTIHPFMHNPIRFNTEENYQTDLQIIKDKFSSLMEVGVRQFGVLADDASAANNDNQVEMLEDLTAWLKEQKANYPDLNINLPYCPEAYFYFNDKAKAQLTALNTAPDNIQIMNTGKATTNNGVWGQVDDGHANYWRNYVTSEGNPGRKPYFWINWPCVDNTKQRLIMGGNDTFLKPGISPADIEGIVINPMMHAEANKSALFATADYAWNVWADKEEADQNWNDSFKYMDHGTAEETDTSTALRELSKHMIKQGQDGRVIELEESVELAPKLAEFRTAFEAGEDLSEKGPALIEALTTIKEAGDLYLEAGNSGVIAAMSPHIKSLRDVADAGLNFIHSAMALNNDNDYDMAWQYYSTGQALLESSKHYTFRFTAPGEDYQMEARAGMQHLVPFDEKMSTALEIEIGPIVNPNIQITKFITSRKDAPAVGTIENILDGNDATLASFRVPNRAYAGDYIGVSYTKPITLENVRFVQGNEKNHLFKSKIQYSVDGKTWTDLNGTIYNHGVTTERVVIEENDIDLPTKIKAVRLIATEDNLNDLWWDVYGIDVNVKKVESAVRYTGTPSYNEDNMNIRHGTVGNITDNADNTFVSFAKQPYENPNRDSIAVDAWVALTFDEAKPIGKIRFLQKGAANAIDEAAIEYSVDGETDWIELDTYTDGRAEYVNDFSGMNITAKAVRIRNLKFKPIWWDVSGLDVYSQFVNDAVDDSTPIEHNIIKTSGLKRYENTGPESNLNDKDDSTCVEYYHTGDFTSAGDYVGYDLGRNAYIGKVHIVVGNLNRDPRNKWEKYRLETSLDNVSWEAFGDDMTGVASGKDVIDVDLKGRVARYIRLVNLKDKSTWFALGEFNVEESKEVGTIRNLYTNTTTSATVIADTAVSKLLDGSSMTLENGEFVGIKLDRIKDIDRIVATFDNENITIEASMNELEWNTVVSETNIELARFIRFINKTENPITFNATALEVYSNEISEPRLHSSSIVKDTIYGDQDTRANGAAFDKKINTETLFAGCPDAGQTIIYDLGQQRTIHDFALFVGDNVTNYMTDAVIEVSETVDGTYTPIVTIGDGEVDEIPLSTNAKDSGYYTTSSKYPNYMSAATSGLDVKGRYVRIRFTADNNTRFVAINEIEINGGEYVPSVNDPTISVSVVEEPGYAPTNMIDGNLSSGYKPNTNNGAITNGTIVYRLSENTGTKKINIIQGAGAISNAKVFVRGSNDDGATSQWKEIGTLGKSFNELINYHFKNVFEVKIEWDGVAPFIQEIIIVEEFIILEGDKTELQEKIDEVTPVYEANKDTYTPTTKKALQDALDDANDVIGMYVVTQELIDKTYDNLVIAYEGVIVKATDLVAFNEALTKANELVEADYTVTTWTPLKDALDSATALSENIEEASQADVNASCVALQTAMDALVKMSDIEALITRIATEQSTYLTGDFTQDTFTVLSEEWTRITNVLATPDTITDEILASANEALDTAIAQLIDLRPLKVAIEEAKDTLGEDAYTPESWIAYTAIIDEVSAVVANPSATVEEIEAAIEKSKTAQSVLAESIEALGALIAKAEAIKNDVGNYTVDSYADLQTVIVNAKAYYNDSTQHTSEATASQTAAIRKAISDLVDLLALRTLINDVSAIENETDYVKASWTAFQTAITNAQAVLTKNNANKDEVAQQITDLNDALAGLVDLRTLRTAIEDAKTIVEYEYTKASYAIFKAAYDAAVEANANDEATAEMISNATTTLQDSIINLVETADKTTLKDCIDNAEPILNEEAIYTPETFAKFKSAYDYAEKIFNEDPSVDQIDEAIARLEEAIAGLHKFVNLKDEKTKFEINGTTETLPENAKINVVQITNLEQLANIKGQLPKYVAKVAPYDITLTVDGNLIQPNGKVALRMVIPKGYEKTRLAVYRFHEGKVEEMPYKIDGNYVIVNTDKFSIYAIVEMKGSEPTPPSTPTDDNTSMGPLTGDSKSLLSIGFAFVLSLAGYVVILKKRKKELNISID